MRVILLIPAAALLAAAGCSSSTNAAKLGAPLPAGAKLVEVRDLKPAAGPVELKGTMVEKCPVAGCWFMLRDSSGLIKVDTKGAGFTVTNVPVNAQVKVAGVFKDKGERLVAATGMEY